MTEKTEIKKFKSRTAGRQSNKIFNTTNKQNIIKLLSTKQ